MANPVFLVARSHQRFAVDEISAVAAVRRHAMQLASWSGFSEIEMGRSGIVATELATNIVKHAGSGEVLLRSLDSNDDNGRQVEIIALDRGPGIGNLDACMRDGMSSAGTAGGGLGAMRRLTDEFEVYTQPGRGSVFYMTVISGAKPAPAAVQWGAVSLAKSGEEACGDAWYGDERGDERDVAMLGIADGLGHGPDAETAARVALGVMADNSVVLPGRLLEMAQQQARPTRGAAVAFAALQSARDTVQYSAIGNITGNICGDDTRRHLISHNGIVGHTPTKVREMVVEWPPYSVVILHSDGISAQWDLSAYPGLVNAHPALIAAVLYRDFCRKTDDATVVAVRRRPLSD